MSELSYVVEINNIPAHLLGTEHTITAGDATVKVSALSYALSMITEAEKNAFEHKATVEDWENTACALYTYAYYAAEYIK